MKNFFRDFKAFALKGNMVDLAIGMVIATAFNAIVSAIVNNLIMPFFGAFLGGQNLASRSFYLNGVQICYGAFLQALIDFVIIAFSIFVAVRLIRGAERKIYAKEFAKKEAEEKKKKAEEEASAKLKADADAKAKAELEEYYNNVREQVALLKQIKNELNNK